MTETEGMTLVGCGPRLGYSREDPMGELVEFWQVFSYLIVCDPEVRPMAILQVIHSSRDIAALLMKK